MNVTYLSYLGSLFHNYIADTHPCFNFSITVIHVLVMTALFYTFTYFLYGIIRNTNVLI